tara:strand:+ start:1778 stop:2707 length:930 start_codon:yes stop_codon:yes gene_type:complete
MDKVFYNQASAAKLGWEPSWFGEKYNDEDLVKAVKRWQKTQDLTADGLVGPMTYRRIWTEREANISNHIPTNSPYGRGQTMCRDDNYIIHNGKFIDIDWPKVVLWDDPDGFESRDGTYYDYSGKEDRKPTMFVNHWDVCLSSESCAKVLNRRGVSVHFLIDNDGTIYQMLDTQHAAWHAGHTHGNKKGIGVEISNGYYTKYQDWYKKSGFGERPIQEHAWVHGRKLDPFLDFYPIQIKALQALWYAVHKGLGIPLEYPRNSKTGYVETGIHKDCDRGKFKGFCNHYNFTRRKIDCAGLDLPTLLEELKE